MDMTPMNVKPGSILLCCIVTAGLNQMGCASYSAREKRSPATEFADHKNLSSENIEKLIRGTKIAITMDDLPKYSGDATAEESIRATNSILATFHKYRVPEVYGFVNASWMVNDPGLKNILDVWTASGYPIGNHTYDHLFLGEQTAAVFNQDIDRNEAYLQRYIRPHQTKYFRFPFLEEGAEPEKKMAVRKHLFAAGYKIAEVSLDFQDWTITDAFIRCTKKGNLAGAEAAKAYYTTASQEALEYTVRLTQAMYGRKVPLVLLIHLGPIEMEMLDSLLHSWKRQGIEFIKLSEVMQDPIYSSAQSTDDFYPGNGSYLGQVLQGRHQTPESLHVIENIDPEADPRIQNLCPDAT
jgi:peptidoglycan/xylan/chitin deacetylase (PgdA/CDA1 family)